MEFELNISFTYYEIFFFRFFFNPFSNIKTNLNSLAIEKQVADQIWSMGQSLPAPGSGYHVLPTDAVMSYEIPMMSLEFGTHFSSRGQHGSDCFIIISATEADKTAHFINNFLETQALNDTLDQMNLIDIYRTFHPKITEYTFFSSAHGTFCQGRLYLGSQVKPW